jgi:formate dehydrogenase subunit gamma
MRVRRCSLTQAAHAVVAVLFIALILGHIYIGTLGMEGAFEAMGTGEVELGERASRPLARPTTRRRRPERLSATPAE